MKIKMIIAAVMLSLPTMALAQTDTRTACDFEKVQDFVEWFKGSEANQRSATAEPLEAAFDDYDEDGKKLEMQYEPHAHDELGWPILPHLGPDWQETFVEHDANTVEYVTAGGMGYIHTYLFKREPCWQLVKFTHDMF